MTASELGAMLTVSIVLFVAVGAAYAVWEVLDNRRRRRRRAMDRHPSTRLSRAVEATYGSYVTPDPYIEWTVVDTDLDRDPAVEEWTRAIATGRVSIVHAVPLLGDGGLLPCCGRTPFEVPRTDRLAIDADLVTCPGRPPSLLPDPSAPPTRSPGRPS
jgi:hypothetical protein